VSNENVVPFKVIAAEKDAEPEVVTADFTPEQTELVQSLTDMVEFMLENKHAIRNFVCSFSMDAPNDSGDTECRVLSSPIEARDFALLIKVLENSFFRNLNGG